jgi:hypothetical protein
MENCFKANSTMRALREATHTTNIGVPPSQSGPFASSLGDIPESSGSNATSAFQPIFNWGKSQPTFLSRFNQPTTPGYCTLVTEADPKDADYAWPQLGAEFIRGKSVNIHALGSDETTPTAAIEING